MSWTPLEFKLRFMGPLPICLFGTNQNGGDSYGHGLAIQCEDDPVASHPLAVMPLHSSPLSGIISPAKGSDSISSMARPICPCRSRGSFLSSLMAEAESSTAQFIFYRLPRLGASSFDLRLAPAHLDRLAGCEGVIANIDKALGTHLEASTLGAYLDKVARPEFERVVDALGDDHLATLADSAYRRHLGCISGGHTFSLAEMRKLSRLETATASLLFRCGLGQRQIEETNVEFRSGNEVGQVDLEMVGVKLF